MRRLAVVIVMGSWGSWGLGSLACQTRNATTVPSPRLGLRLTTPEVARQLSRQSLRVDIAFDLAGRGVSGTGILLGFLQRMQTYRASYVSELSYALQMRYGGKDIECVSKIRVDDGRREAAERTTAAPDDDDDGEVEYTTTIKPWRPRATDAWVVDREMVCKKHAQQVQAYVPRYETTYNAEVGRALFAKDMPAETSAIVYYDECSYEPHRRYVHRYEHFIAARFSPPDLDDIARRYADLPLVQEPPLCHEIRLAPGQHLRQHIDADVHFPAEIVPDRENVFRPLPPVPTPRHDPG